MDAPVREQAFDAAVCEIRPQLMQYALKLCRDRNRAEDLVQDTIVRALTNHHRFERGTNLRGWLFTICFNAFCSGSRRAKREVGDPDGLIAASVPVPEEQPWVVEMREVRGRLRFVPKGLRDALLLVALDGRTYEEAATILNTEVGTIKSRVNRARALLEGREPEPEPEAVHVSGLDIEAVRRLYVSGMAVSEIATHFDGVSGAEVLALVAEHRMKRGARS